MGKREAEVFGVSWRHYLKLWSFVSLYSSIARVGFSLAVWFRHPRK
jgi:hypothetical protein